MSKLDVAITMLVASCVLVVTGGLLLTVLWSWFVQPLFAGAPDLNVGEAIGLSLVAGRLHGQTESDRKRGQTTSDTRNILTTAIARQLLALAIALVLHYVFGVGR